MPSVSDPGPICTTRPLPEMALPLKSVPCVIVLLRLNASVALSVIALPVASEPVAPPCPVQRAAGNCRCAAVGVAAREREEAGSGESQSQAVARDRAGNCQSGGGRDIEGTVAAESRGRGDRVTAVRYRDWATQRERAARAGGKRIAVVVAVAERQGTERGRGVERDRGWARDAVAEDNHGALPVGTPLLFQLAELMRLPPPAAAHV